MLLTLPALLAVSTALLVLEITSTRDAAGDRGAAIAATSDRATAQAAGAGASVAAVKGPAGDAAAAATKRSKKAKKAKQAKREKQKRAPLQDVDGTVSFAAVGDIVMGSRTYGFNDGGGRALFTGVDASLAADVVLGNLEGVLAAIGTAHCQKGAKNCFAFRSDPDEARWLRRAGFTTLNLANNHANDFGADALRETRRALADQRIDHTGAPGQITLSRVGDIRVAAVGFSAYSWGADLRDVAGARALVKKANGMAHIVLVTMHAGAEGAAAQHVVRGVERYLGQNRGDVAAFARAAVDAGADLVVGHGPHVLRGMEWYKGRLIAYSLGNFAGYNVFNLAAPRNVSGILRATLNADGTWVRGKLVATKLVGKGVPIRDGAKEAHALVRQLSRTDFKRSGVRINPRGVLLPPRS